MEFSSKSIYMQNKTKTTSKINYSNTFHCTYHLPTLYEKRFWCLHLKEYHILSDELRPLHGDPEVHDVSGWA